MSEPVIEVRHLSKSFGTHVVLRDVDFTVNAGDVTCIIGASGSGKSTLLRHHGQGERPLRLPRQGGHGVPELQPFQ